MIAVVQRALTSRMVGPYNACNHVPETNASFMKRLRQAVHWPWSPPAPAFAVKLGSYVIGVEPSAALHGQRCVPRRLDEERFVFAHENLSESLNTLLRELSANRTPARGSTEMDLQLRGKTALVSGSTVGIGFAIASTLAREGAAVIVNGRRQERVDEAIARITKSDPSAQLRGAAGDLSTAGGADAVASGISGRRHPRQQRRRIRGEAVL